MTKNRENEIELTSHHGIKIYISRDGNFSAKGLAGDYETIDQVKKAIDFYLDTKAEEFDVKEIEVYHFNYDNTFKRERLQPLKDRSNYYDGARRSVKCLNLDTNELVDRDFLILSEQKSLDYNINNLVIKDNQLNLNIINKIYEINEKIVNLEIMYRTEKESLSKENLDLIKTLEKFPFEDLKKKELR